MANVQTQNITLINAKGQEITLASVLETLNSFMAEYAAKQKNYGQTVLVAEPGKKYIRLVHTEIARETGEQLPHRSAYCFLDLEGNIFKSSSWKIPAKGIRGTVFDDNCSWGKGLGPYGAAYLR